MKYILSRDQFLNESVATAKEITDFLTTNNKGNSLFKLYDNGSQKPQPVPGENTPMDIPTPPSGGRGAEAPAVNLSTPSAQSPTGTSGTAPAETGALPPPETPPTSEEVNIGDQFT